MGVRCIIPEPDVRVIDYYARERYVPKRGAGKPHNLAPNQDNHKTERCGVAGEWAAAIFLGVEPTHIAQSRSDRGYDIAIHQIKYEVKTTEAYQEIAALQIFERDLKTRRNREHPDIYMLIHWDGDTRTATLLGWQKFAHVKQMCESTTPTAKKEGWTPSWRIGAGSLYPPETLPHLMEAQDHE